MERRRGALCSIIAVAISISTSSRYRNKNIDTLLLPVEYKSIIAVLLDFSIVLHVSILVPGRCKWAMAVRPVVILTASRAAFVVGPSSGSRGLGLRLLT